MPDGAERLQSATDKVQLVDERFLSATDKVQWVDEWWRDGAKRFRRVDNAASEQSRQAQPLI